MLLIKLYPNKNHKLNKNCGLEKVLLSPAKQKKFIIKSSWKHNWNSGMIDTNIIEILLKN